MNRLAVYALAGLACLLSFVRAGTTASSQLVLADFRSPDGPRPETKTWRAAFVSGATNEVATDSADSGSLYFPAPTNGWNLSGFRTLVAAAVNTGTNRVSLTLRAKGPAAGGKDGSAAETADLAPGESRELVLAYHPLPWRPSEPLDLKGMRGWPGQPDRFDLAKTRSIEVMAKSRGGPARFRVDALRLEGTIETIPASTFLPFVDRYGQFRHASWPGKLASEADWPAGIEAEERDRAAQPGPADRNGYGGWTAGPTLKATGFFRAEKVDGRWWLVDPEGRLFWSHGIDCVRAESATPVTDREAYFQDLPPSNGPFKAFYHFSRNGAGAPHGFYTNRSYQSFNFAGANLFRKYGDEWKARSADAAHARLKSWGLNTIGNWSDEGIAALRRTPYVATVNSRSRPIEGSTGYWGKFFDVFAPEFRPALRSAFAAQKGKAAGDPWCLGFFVHNEISWGNDDKALALGALASPADQPAKQAFIEDLKKKYGDIAKLNDAWGATNASWEALLAETRTPDPKKAAADLTAFTARIADTYFRVIREELKAAAPGQLYLGCRFAWTHDTAIRAAAAHCDVVSFNKYTYTLADLKLPDGCDRPVIIGEFHFGALDRGMFHTGLRTAHSQADRADKYRAYLRSALDNPLVVGTHWFQYRDQCLTGRGDGENYQIGFVDICDTPYLEIVAAAREIGREMYRRRTD